MSYTLADLDIINLRNLATPNKKYLGENGRVYVGTKEGRLLLEDAASNVTFDSTSNIDANNVQDAIEDLSDNADANAQDAVGSILVDTATIGLTYDSSTPSIYADLLNTAVTAGTYGSATQVPQITIDAQGRITNAVNTSISLTGTFWELTGNSGTIAGTNFIGTIDNIDLVFKRSNAEAGFIGIGNTGFGLNTLKFTTLGTGNSAFGLNSLAINDGNYNTVVGSDAMYGNPSGSNLAILGSGIGAFGLASGSNTTAIGAFALFNLDTGDNNIAIGYQAGYNLTTESNRVFIGNSSTSLPTSSGSDQVLTRNSITGEINFTNESGIVKTSRTLTINGSTQNLSANRTWTITTTGTANRISVTGGTGLTPTIDIAATYIGQSSITTLGTITTGVWNGTAIANANLANSTISGISLGSNLATLTIGTGLTGTSYNGSTGVTIAVDGSYVPTTATNAVNVGITDDTTTNTTMYPTWVTANSGNLPIKVSSTKLNFNPSTGSLTSTGNIITPLIIGGTGVGDIITYKSTTGIGTSSALAHTFVGGTNGGTTLLTLNNSGQMGFGANPISGANINIAKSISGGASWHSVFNGFQVTSVATSAVRGYSTNISTEASAFTLTALHHFIAEQSTIGAGSAITNQYGFNAESNLTGASTINAGFRGNISAAATRWNLYMIGTAQNYLAGNLGIGQTTPTASLHIRAGTATASTAPLKFTSGTNLTAAETGVIEYDGVQYYKTIDTTSGRGAVPVEQYYHLTTAGSTISTIANYFGTTSNISLVASGYYEIEIVAYFLNTTAGTVTWTLTNSAAPTSQNIYYEMSPITGIVAPPGTATMLTGQLYNDTTAALAITTGTLTDAVNHYSRIKIWLKNGTGTSLKIQATKNVGGTITPGINSWWKCRRMSPNNIGTFAA